MRMKRKNIKLIGVLKNKKKYQESAKKVTSRTDV